MASEFPNSYKDSTYAALDARTEEKLGLPAGLLSAIRTRGERSNHDQVSEAGATTPYQFIPSTRKLIIDKYGIDPTLNPENASEAAGLLLQEGLRRNKGDAALAVAEYHGGTNRANWGPRTREYVQRVTGALQPASEASPTDASPQPAPAAPSGPSTFDRVLASMGKPSESQMASVFQAYKLGQMPPEAAKEFEEDVRAGHVMLPRGETLNAPAPAPAGPGAVALPPQVAKAYADGSMAVPDRIQLEQDARDGLIQLPQGLALQDSREPGLLAKVGQAAVRATERGPGKMAIDVGKELIGQTEAGLQLITGATGGALGLTGGLIGGLVGAVTTGEYGTKQGVDRVSDAAVEGAQKLTYEPRTERGRELSDKVGRVMQELTPLTGHMGEVGAIMEGARPAAAQVLERAGIPPARPPTAPVAAAEIAPIAGEAAPVARPAAATAARPLAIVPEEVAPPARPAAPAAALPEEVAPPARPAPTPGSQGSAGAAGTDIATQRRAAAAALPEPIELTEGQASRRFEQQQFERETAKNPTVGAPLRERFAAQNEAILRNFDHWVDQTGARIGEGLRAVGAAVDKALVRKADRDKTAIRVAYKEAEKAGELEAPVSTKPIVDFLNANVSVDSVAPVLEVARKELMRLGGATRDGEGAMIPGELSLRDAELVRRQVGNAIGIDPTNIKFGSDLKRAIDTATEGAGGNLYRTARAMRARYAEQYENRAVISKLLRSKRGTEDRTVAFEDVFDHTILRGSRDDVAVVRKVLQTGGPEGQQAWRELQGATLNHLREQATKNVARDERGNPIVSAAALDKAIKALDADGKLDMIFGRRGAEQLRDLNDIAKDVLTSVPGSVNNSNTASVLLAAFDMALSGTIGMPAPVATGLKMIVTKVKDKKLKARVQQALGNQRGQ